MKIEEKPPELPAESSTNASAIFVLEAENFSLRRLVVELLEKNQLLRDELRTLTNGHNSEISDGLAASHRVDPWAA